MSAEFGHYLWNFPEDLVSEYCLFVFSLFFLISQCGLLQARVYFLKKWAEVFWSMLSKPTGQNINMYVQVMYCNLVLT